MDRVRRRLRLYGHRGSSAHLPENTLEAFRRALTDGANALEMDVHRSADGHFVVIHDADGLRTAGEASLIRSTTLAEIKNWNVGRVLGSSYTPQHQVPTLDEVLDEFSHVPFSIDLKPNDTGIVAPLLDLLGTRNADGHVTLASFHERVIRAVRRLGYPGRTAFSRLEIAYLRLLPAPLARRIVKGQAMHTPLFAGLLRLDGKRLLQRCRQIGVRADYWVVNDPDTARALVERGATGIMTDAPDVIAPALECGLEEARR